MELVPRTADLDEAWDALVDGSPEGWVFALAGWQRLILSVPDWGLKEHSIGIVHGGDLLAVLPLQHQPVARRVGSSGFGGAGPVVAAGVPPGLRRRTCDRLFQHVFDVCRDVGALRLDMAQSPVTRAALGNRWGVAPYLEYGLRDTSTVSRVTRLDVSEEDLWRGLSQNARQMARRAQSSGYTVERTDWSGQVDDYYRIHEETYRRTGVTPHPRAYFEGIAREMGPRGRAVLWVGRSPEGAAVAFHNDARMADASMYHTGCCETAHLGAGINYLLFWEAIRGARQEGCRWYELGEVFPFPRTDKERGLSVFKSKFGGELHRSFKWVREWQDMAGLDSTPAMADASGPLVPGPAVEPTAATPPWSSHPGRLAARLRSGTHRLWNILARAVR